MNALCCCFVDGMVIVECAAFGVVSVVHHRDIGACELLKDSVFSTDMTRAEIAARDVMEILKNREMIGMQGITAKRISMGYNINKFRIGLRQLVME